jgi:CRP-like cAMP-binding protein
MKNFSSTASYRGSDAKPAAMAALALFAGCSRATLLELGQCFDTATVPAGAALEREGDRTRWLYVLLEGAVLVTTASRAQRVLRPGDCWGDHGPSRPRHTAHASLALTLVTVLSLDRRSLGRVTGCSPAVAERLRGAWVDLGVEAAHVPELADVLVSDPVASLR